MKIFFVYLTLLHFFMKEDNWIQLQFKAGYEQYYYFSWIYIEFQTLFMWSKMLGEGGVVVKIA